MRTRAEYGLRSPEYSFIILCFHRLICMGPNIVAPFAMSSYCVLPSAEFLGESDEKPFRPLNVAEPIRVLISDYFAYELRATIAEPFERLVDIVHREHDAKVA